MNLHFSKRGQCACIWGKTWFFIPQSPCLKVELRLYMGNKFLIVLATYSFNFGNLDPSVLAGLKNKGITTTGASWPTCGGELAHLERMKWNVQIESSLRFRLRCVQNRWCSEGIWILKLTSFRVNDQLSPRQLVTLKMQPRSVVKKSHLRAHKRKSSWLYLLN